MIARWWQSRPCRWRGWVSSVSDFDHGKYLFDWPRASVQNFEMKKSKCERRMWGRVKWKWRRRNKEMKWEREKWNLFAKNCKKNGVYCCYRYCSKLFGKIRKETEFRQRCCQNCKKKYNVSGERENWISVMRLPKFLSYTYYQACPWSAQNAC